MSLFNKSIGFVALLFFFTGCVSNSGTNIENNTAGQTSTDRSSLQEQGKDSVVCTYEKAIGKMIKKKICYTRRQKEAFRESSKDIMRSIDGHSQSILQ